MFSLRTRVGEVVDDPKTLAQLARMGLELVIANNRVTLRTLKRRGRPVPPVYMLARKGGRVRYERERKPGEEFADLLTVLRRGWGDCDDLIAWRIAELRELGENAKVRIYWRTKIRNGQPVHRMHCQVRRGNGWIEDPSRFLGL